MSAAVWLGNVFAHALQVAVLVVVGAVLARLTRVRSPGALLAWWQMLLLAAVALPVLQPWPSGRIERDGSAVEIAATTAAPAGNFPWAPVLVVILAAGFMLRLARLAFGLLRLRRWRGSARPLEGVIDGAIVAEATRRAAASARLFVSPAVDVPATYGARRPIVLLPDRFVGLIPSHQRDVLLHELLHVRRRDWPIAMAEELAGALLWFHPAVAWLRGRIRLAREQVVDATVVARTGERRAYLETLLAFARVEGAPSPAAAFFSPPQLESRVDALMKEDTMSRARTWVVLAVSAAVVALAAAKVVAAVPMRSPGEARTMAAAEPSKTARERKVMQKVQPTYPAEAKKKGVEGIVLLDVVITKAGDVTSVQPVKGPEELREAAASAVRQWKYEPGGVDTRATITIRFLLAKKGD